MKTSVSFRFLVLSAFFFLSEIFSLGQEDRPGIECGCDKTGKYVAPAVKNITVEEGSASNEGSSSKGKYKLYSSLEAGGVTIGIYYNGVEIFNETNSTTGWGFSPDEDRFVMFGQFQNMFWIRLVNLNPDPYKEGEPAVIVTGHNLFSATNLSSAKISFSTHGKYLLFAGLDKTSVDKTQLILYIFNSKTGDAVYEIPGTFVAGYASGASGAGWGFSPDAKDATFVFAYLTSSYQYSVEARKLTASSSKRIMISSNNQGQALFRFSPCGDYFAWVYSTAAGFKASLYKTNVEYATSEGPWDAEMFDYIAAYDDKHYIVYSKTDSVVMADNLAGIKCRDEEKPKWSDDAIIDTGLVQGVTMQLHWNGAKDDPNPSVAAYHIYKKEKEDDPYILYKEIEADSMVTVTGLKPNSAYYFKVEAGDEAGNWSSTGPDSTFSTLTDNFPTWPDPVITPKGITETRMTLTWKKASDDYGIELYKIFMDKFMDNDAIDSVRGDILEYKIKGLTAGTEHHFLIKARDAAFQYVSGTELTQWTAPLKRPEWPEGAVLKDSAQTETSLIVKWPAATDNCNAVIRYKIILSDGKIDSTFSNLREYLVTGLKAGTSYMFKVVAIDESRSPSDTLKADLSTLPDYVAEPLIKADGNQRRPDISGKMVVWWSDNLDTGDIYSYDLEIDSLRRITNDPHRQFDPAVSGDRIVWTDDRNLNNDIFLYDPVLGEVPVCTAPLFQNSPAIDGDIIVWEDYRNGNYDIYMYDIKTGKEIPVSTRKSNQRWPDVSGNYIVYADDRNGNWDIFMYGIYEHKEEAVCTEEHDQTFPVVTNKWREELIVAYMDNRNGENIYFYFPDKILGQEWEYLVPLDVYPFKTPQSYPHFEDNLLVFQDPLGGPGADFNIWAYQYYEYSGIDCKKKEICVDYPSAKDQIRPRTSQGNIVWQDERNGNSDIYIWHRPPFSDLQISVKEITDPIAVGDTLKYIVTVKNDGPRMNTSIRTECTLPVVAILDTAIADKGTVTYRTNVIWKIDTLRNGASASLEIAMITFDLAILEFKAVTKGKDFDPENSNNEVTAKTKVKEFIPSFVDTGNSPSIEVEPDGRSHLIYFANDNLMYATSARKGKWEYKSLGPCVSCVENNMVLDKDGNIQIVAFDDIYSSDGSYAKCRLYHWTLKRDGQWSKNIIALSDSGFHSLSLKVDSRNELHLVFQNALGGAYHENFKEMRTVGGKWSQPEIFSYGYDDVDMAIDKEDKLQTSYYVTDTGPVYQKKNSSGDGNWNEYEVVEPGWSGLGEGMKISIASDDHQNPHIFYQGGGYSDGGYQKYAWKTNNKWNIQTVDEKYASPGKIVIDQDSIANLSYCWSQPVPYGQYSALHIRYATNIAGPWISEEVDENVGRSSFGLTMDMDRDIDKYSHFVYTGGSDSLRYVLVPPLKYFKVDPETLDFGSVEPGSAKIIALNLINPMSENISIDLITANDERISFDKKSFILYNNSSESVNVTLKQTEAFWSNTHMMIWYNSTSGSFMDVPVSAKNWAPVLTSDQDPVDFGAVTLNSLVTKTVKLENSGVTDLIISDITVNATPADFKLVGQNCSILQPGQTCDVQLSFKPTKNPAQQSYLNISSNDPVTPSKKITIKGKATYPQINCQISKVEFGYCPVGQSVIKTITIKNTGELMLNITSASLSGTYSNQFSLSSPCTSIAPGASCDMQITMSPTTLADLQATLYIRSNSFYSSTLTVNLIGSSVVKTLGLSATLISFGSVHVGEQSQKLLELQNTGSTSITVAEIYIGGNNYCEFRQNSGYQTIAAGATSTVTVSFIPQSEGEKTAILVIESNDTFNPVQKATLTGQAGSTFPLQVSISADPSSGSEPLNVTFHASVTGGQPPWIFKWDFDDMKISESDSPVHKFTGPGIFNVSLKVTDISNNSVSATTKIGVTAEGVPVVIASAQPANGEIPLSVQFNAQVIGGDAPLTYLWDFSDGSTSTLQNPLHVFNSAGNYLVRLAVTDSDNDKCRDSVLVKAMLNNSIAGQIWDETGLSQVTKANLILYPQNNINETTSLVINGSNSYLFPGLPVVYYAVLAVPDIVSYSDLLPTYFGDKLALFEASWVQASGHVTGKDIRLVKKPLTGIGLGTITGSMVYGSKKGLTITEKPDNIKGNPVAGVYVFLKSTTDGKLKAFSKTGSDGSFGFEKLENGSYYFVADCQGKPMDAANTPIVISDTRKDIEILATVGTDKITVKDLATGIEDGIPVGLKVYPVPAGDYITVIIPQGMFSGKSVRLRILDFSGKHIYIDNNYEMSGNPVTLDINFLSDGIYLLEITDKQTCQRVKILKMK
ncbi:MAG: choice-of-anchor D domain-containing protein [Bacteroidales bacterium]|nr:choice-of-anchor D domain-containing protein [Bacteroidales bacterium]